MRLSHRYYVYILSSKTRRLYIGVTNNLERRVQEHKEKAIDGFTSRYNIDRLVYYEETNDVRDALDRERALKGWRRERKLALVESANPSWQDLALDWWLA